MAGPIATAVQGKYNKNAARANEKYAAAQQRAGMQLINSLDYEPMYASERVPTFQRSQSPVARSYIESYLMGNNPDSISSTRAGAGAAKARAQLQQNQMFGTPDDRLQQQRAYMATTPWQVTPPTRSVKSTIATPDVDWNVQNADFAAAGINKDLNDALTATGTNLPALRDLSGNRKKSGLDAFLQLNQQSSGVEDLLKNYYNGDATKLAADIKAAGGLAQLTAKLKAGK